MGYHNRQRRILMNEGETQVPKRLEADALLPHLTPKPPAAPPVLSIRLHRRRGFVSSTGIPNGLGSGVWA
jgi:hypothetical protein